MKLCITINNADKKYDEIMHIINKLKEIDNVEEIGGNINDEKTELFLNIEG